MANPLEKLRKIRGRSWAEIRARSGQALSVYAEQVGLSGKLPSDTEFQNLIETDNFDKPIVTGADLLQRFYDHAEYSFFPSFRQGEDIFEVYHKRFGGPETRQMLERADKLADGKFDLLGFEGLDFGRDVDWHFEPVNGIRAPVKHWKQFDELSTDETGDKKVIWELNRHQHFFTLGVAYGLTGEESYARTFARHLRSWMRENPPGMGINWFSSLEVSLRAISWVWAFHLFRGSASLTPALFEESLRFLLLHGRHLEKYLSTYYSPNTHLTGEALGLYYLGTQFPFFKTSTAWRALGEDILFSELDRQILPDGGYFEQSTWYHRYTVDFYSHFLILKTLNGRRTEKFLNEKLIAKLQTMMNFVMHLTRPDGTVPRIGDGDSGRCLPLGRSQTNDFRGCLSTGAVLFDRGDYKFQAAEFSPETLWLLGLDGLERFDSLEESQPEKRSILFEKSGYAVMRDGWTATDNFLLVDCGEVGALRGGHGHADALAINVAVGGRTLLIDPGTYTYHESMELRDQFRTTSAHNTLEIDGKSQSEPGDKFSWSTRANSYFEEWISEPRFDFFAGAHDGYERLEEAPARHSRSILFLKNDYWIMRDYVKTTGRHQYGLNFHFESDAFPTVETAENGEKCIAQINLEGIGARIFTFGDNGNWVQKDTFTAPSYGNKASSRLMQFASEGTGPQEFFTFLMPDEADFESPVVYETDVRGGRAFVIRFNNYTDLMVFSDGEQIVSTEFFNTSFRFLWARISEGGDRVPEEYVLIGGRHFSVDGCEVINYPNILEYATARRFGNQLNVQTPVSVLSIALPDS